MHYYLFNFLKTKCFEILVIFNALDSNKECQLNKPREFWRAVRPFMHVKKSAPEQCITLKDQETVIRDQNQVAETMNEYFTNITKDLKLDEHLSFRTQSHFPKIHGANGCLLYTSPSPRD